VDRPITPGSWRYAGGAASYVSPIGTALFALGCDAASRRLFASRGGSAAGSMTLRATTGARSYPTVIDAAGVVTATIAANDPQLDALSFSRGRILIALDGAPDLILPVWPELARTVEDCR